MEYSTLPTHAQYMERKRLRNEIVTEIRNDLGMNTADAEWTKVRQEINLKIDTEISMVNNTNEEVGARLALTEVLVDQMGSKFETIMTARIEERIQDEWKKLKNDRNETNQMQHRILDLETQQIQMQGEGKILEQRIQDLEATNLHQADEIQRLKQQETTPARENPRMATPEPAIRYKEERENDERYSTPKRDYGRKDEGDDRHDD